jgi:NAD(P)-dependent dehydrogenase (short-subunit alcohol dehydrogenase family)
VARLDSAVTRLAHARVLVTGASSGLGAAAAWRFAREGADVALLARSRDGLERVAAGVRAQGARALVVPADVGDREAVERAVQEAAATLGGGLDVLVGAAGVAGFARFDEQDADAFDRTVDVTFTGAARVLRAALPHLERGLGRAVVVASTMSRAPLPGFAAYAAAKHALRGFVGSLRIELRAQGSPVAVSLLHPGPVDSPLWRTVTSATGRQPLPPPFPYRADAVARAAVALALRPRREATVGLEGRVAELVPTLARPVGDLALLGVYAWYRSGRRRAEPPGNLWAPSGTGEASGGLLGARPSLWGRLRVR